MIIYFIAKFEQYTIISFYMHYLNTIIVFLYTFLIFLSPIDKKLKNTSNE